MFPLNTPPLLPPRSPHRATISSRIINGILDATRDTGGSSVSIYQHGTLVAKWGDISQRERPGYSLAKTVAALAIAKLVSDGKLSFDSSIDPYLIATGRCVQLCGQGITVRHLLTHTSGVAVAEDLSTAQINFAPGMRFEYGSGATHLLALIIEGAANVRAQQYIDEHIFAPLAMKNTKLEVLPNGYVNTCTGLTTNPADMMRIGMLLLNGGRIQGTQFIAEAVMAELRLAASTCYPHARDGGENCPNYCGHILWLDTESNMFYAGASLNNDIYVLPKSNVVVVRTQEKPYMSGKQEQYFESFKLLRELA